MPTFRQNRAVFGENSIHISKHDSAQDKAYYSSGFQNGDVVRFGVDNSWAQSNLSNGPEFR